MAPLTGGSLEAALHAARAHRMRNPGDDDAKRVVESLELLQSQVWFGGSDDGAGRVDEGFVTAAQHLSSANLEGALGSYEEILRAQPDEDRAARLALHARVVIAASQGQALPAPESIRMASQPKPVEQDFSDSTRVADEGELPLGAFAYDDVTANVDSAIPGDAFRDEPTRDLDMNDFEIVEDRDENARVTSPGPAPRAEPPPPRRPGKRPAPTSEAKETTRIAGPGELPLDELKKLIAGEADQDLDLLLDEIEESSRPSIEPPAALAQALEPGLDIDIDIDDGLFDGPPPAPEPEAVEEPSQRAFPRPSGLEPPSAILKPPPVEELERQLAPSRIDSGFASEPASARYDSSRPPPAMTIPSAAELARDPVHQALETSEVALPARGRWEVHEPGRESGPEAGLPPLEAAVDSSWAGIRVPYDEEPAHFEPGLEDLDRDSWDDPTEVGAAAPEREAEAAFMRGDLPEALRLYQDLATQFPDEQRLWDRVAEIARAIQNRES